MLLYIFAAAKYCSPGAIQANCASVSVICGDNWGQCAGVQLALQRTAAFTTVDAFDAFSSTPSLSYLSGFDAVFVFSAITFSDASLLGNRLATYYEGGGGVVVALYANANFAGNFLQGTFGTAVNGYALLDYSSGSYTSSADSLGQLLEPQSPLLKSVNSISTSVAQSTASIIGGRALVVAKWQGGAPFVLRGARGNRTLVELNFYPGLYEHFDQWAEDAARLMRNALKYSRCIDTGELRMRAMALATWPTILQQFLTQ